MGIAMPKSPFMRSAFLSLIFAISAISAISVSPIAMADQSSDSTQTPGLEEIIVTARKREETAIAVPIPMTSITGAQLQSAGIYTLDDLARQVPELVVGGSGGIQGGSITLRGVGSGAAEVTQFAQQAVSFNIDGISLAIANVRQISELDLAQVDVLKGPQALFYGKNSPAGVIAMRSADPTQQLEGKVSVSYDPYGEETRTEDYISGPITDGLGFRLAASYDHLGGYLTNTVPANADLYVPSQTNVPWRDDIATRLTLKFDPSEQVSARLKLNYAQTVNSGPASATEVFACPYGSPQSGQMASCQAGNLTTHPGMGQVVGRLDPNFGSGVPYQHEQMALAALNIDYRPVSTLTLSSVTGYSYMNLREADNMENDYVIALPSTDGFRDKEFTQELRIQSSYSGPWNFLGGLYYTDETILSGAHPTVFATSPATPVSGLFYALCPPTAPCNLSNYVTLQESHSFSVFGQLSYKPIPTVEVSAGGRETFESGGIPEQWSGAGFGVTNGIGLNVSNTLYSIGRGGSNKFNNFSPEVTINWRPTNLLTIYGSYKEGFLSGGFNGPTPSHPTAAAYSPEVLKDFEVGVKTELLDRTLSLNADAYNYKISDLQVASFANSGTSISSTIGNAGKARVTGVEADATYKTPLPGVSLRSGAAYTHGIYTSYANAPCYLGQTPTAGCALSPSIGTYTQDLTGNGLARSPHINLNGGVGYNTDVLSTYKAGVSVDAYYTSSYMADANNSPLSRQPAYTLINSTFRFTPENEKWEFTVIGKNLTNRYYFTDVSGVPFTGSAGGNPKGTFPDYFGPVSRGREVMLRASYKF